jgi:four helix bundle protein
MRRCGYHDLLAWQKAMDLVAEVYGVVKDWPRHELYALSDQTRRAAVSVPANIAEGQGRASPKEFAHHLSIAHGSLCELETHLAVAQRLVYINEGTLDDFMERAAEVGRLIQGLRRKQLDLAEAAD